MAGRPGRPVGPGRRGPDALRRVGLVPAGRAAQWHRIVLVHLVAVARLHPYGDDYPVKPFAIEELAARVRSLCRRVTAGRAPVLRCGDREIDSDRHEVCRAGVLLTSTTKEFAVLDVLLIQLRRKPRDPPTIHTVRGVGYRIEPA